jgi:hypothetical protein
MTGMGGRLLRERGLKGEPAVERGGQSRRTARSVTVNLAESPLGWLFARGRVTQRQFDAGERLRYDWERAQLAPRVTMAGIRRRFRGAGAVRHLRWT